MSVSWTGPGHEHEHDHCILTTSPVTVAGAVMSWTDYRQCECGDRVPAAVTEMSGPAPAARELQVLHAPMREPEPEAGR
jgi:hypothetical protein